MDERRLKEKLAGRTRYPHNVSSKNMLYVRLLHSPEKVGILNHIQLPTFPESYGFLGPRDIPGKNWITMGQGGMPLFAEKHIRYYQECLGLIYGPDPEVLNRLLGQILLDITPELEKPELNLGNAQNSSYSREIHKGEVDDYFEREDLIVLEDYYAFDELQSQVFPPAHSSCQREGNRFILHTVCQWPWLIQKNISSLLKIPRSKISIKPYPCENNQDAQLLLPILTSAFSALVSHYSKRPCSLVLQQEELNMQPSSTGKVQVYFKGAVNKQGILQALKVDFALDTGAWPLLDKERVDRMCLAATGVYQCRTVEIHGKAHVSSNPPNSLRNEGNLSPINTALELYTAQLARAVDLTPHQWKERNILQKGNCFFTGFSFSRDPKLALLLNKVVSASDFQRKHTAYQYQMKLQKSSPLSNRRGIGLSQGFLGNGFLAAQGDFNALSIKMRLEQDGTLHIHLPVTPGHNQLYKSWTIMAAEILNLEEKDIQFHIYEEVLHSPNGPSSQGRNVTVLNNLIQQCLQKISKRRFRDPLPLEESGRFLKSRRKWKDENFEGMPFQYLSWGACVVELEIDRENNHIKIEHIWIAIDPGEMIIPSLAHTVIERGLRQSCKWLMVDLEEPVPFTLEILPSGTQSKALDGLIQTLFPGAFLQALSLAKGRDQHFIPVDYDSLGGNEL